MAALNKIAPTSPSRQRPSELETSIANALYDLETNIPDMKSALRPLQFVSAREVRCTLQHDHYFLMAAFLWFYLLWCQCPSYDRAIPEVKDSQYIREDKLTLLSNIQIEVGHGKKAIVIFVPVPLLLNFHKVQQRYASSSFPPALPSTTSLLSPQNHH